MFSESAELYDLIYSSFKDYRAESAKLAVLLEGVVPECRTVLDVACGTGEHAKVLSEFGLEVDGLDIDENLLELARQKCPDREFFRADMSSFRLGKTYDVVMCLFSSIGYLQTLDRVTAALTCFREHLSPDGCVVVEPWFAPDEWQIGRVDSRTVKADGVEVIRMSHADARGTISVLTLDYLVGRSSGVEHRREVHELGMFTKDEMLTCFRSAGLSVEHDPSGLTGRGLYVGGKS